MRRVGRHRRLATACLDEVLASLDGDGLELLPEVQRVPVGRDVDQRVVEPRRELLAVPIVRRELAEVQAVDGMLDGLLAVPEDQRLVPVAAVVVAHGTTERVGPGHGGATTSVVIDPQRRAVSFRVRPTPGVEFRGHRWTGRHPPRCRPPDRGFMGPRHAPTAVRRTNPEGTRP